MRHSLRSTLRHDIPRRSATSWLVKPSGPGRSPCLRAAVRRRTDWADRFLSLGGTGNGPNVLRPYCTQPAHGARRGATPFPGKHLSGSARRFRGKGRQRRRGEGAAHGHEPALTPAGALGVLFPETAFLQEVLPMSLVRALRRLVGPWRRGGNTFPKRKSLRPELEALEDRSLPALLTLNAAGELLYTATANRADDLVLWHTSTNQYHIANDGDTILLFGGFTAP